MARIQLTKQDVNKAFEEALLPPVVKPTTTPLLEQLKAKAQKPPEVRR